MSISEQEEMIPSLRIRIDKASGESHYVHFLTQDKHCDCQGFMSHGRCRHIEFAEAIEQAVKNVMPRALEVLNSRTGKAW